MAPVRRSRKIIIASGDARVAREGDRYMGSLVPVIGLLFAAAITPGPNNVIVMEAGSRGGIASAMGATLGVVAGSLFLLTLVWLGVGAAMREWPGLQVALGIGGGAYLTWLGILLIRSHDGNPSHSSKPALPATVPGIAAFQLMNPKAWVLVTTAAAAMPAGNDVVTLGVLIVFVTSICLTVWGAAGALLSQWLARPVARRWFDRIMGALMAVFALRIAIDALQQWSGG
jgi:threonine/homoserine/homoserine lactone efflux protein